MNATVRKLIGLVLSGFCLSTAAIAQERTAEEDCYLEETERGLINYHLERQAKVAAGVIKGAPSSFDLDCLIQFLPSGSLLGSLNLDLAAMWARLKEGVCKKVNAEVREVEGIVKDKVVGTLNEPLDVLKGKKRGLDDYGVLGDAIEEGIDLDHDIDIDIVSDRYGRRYPRRKSTPSSGAGGEVSAEWKLEEILL